MTELYLKEIEITPTSLFTIRKSPFSPVYIASYDFIPPTTISGFLERIRRLVYDEELPQPSTWNKNKIKNLGPFFLKNILCLGGYSNLKKVHTTKRHGYQKIALGLTFRSDQILPPDEYWELANSDNLVLKATAYRTSLGRKCNEIRARLLGENATYAFGRGKNWKMDFAEKGSTYDSYAQLQLHSWDYVLSNEIHCYLTSNDKEKLDELNNIKNYGMKLGKEGYAFVSKIGTTKTLGKKNGEFTSSVIIPAEYALEMEKVESIYYFGKEKYKIGVFALPPCKVKRNYFSNGNINIPEITVKILSERFGWY